MATPDLNTIMQALQKLNEKMCSQEEKEKERFRDLDRRNQELYKDLKKTITHDVKTEIEKLNKKIDEDITLIQNDISDMKQNVSINAESICQNKTVCDSRHAELESKLEQIKNIRTGNGIPQNVTYVYNHPQDARHQLKFYGNKDENPVEFLLECEAAMENIGALCDKDKIQWVARNFRGSAINWYVVIRDGIKTFEELKNKFIARFWNESVQRKVRTTLEFSKFKPGKVSREQYALELIAKCKHLQPQLVESELVQKIANHYEQNVKIAVFTRGVETIESLLNMLSQWEEVHTTYHTTTSTYTNKNNNSYNNNNTNDKKTFNKPKRMQYLATSDDNEMTQKNGEPSMEMYHV